jgi:hypothetical protein
MGDHDEEKMSTAFAKMTGVPHEEAEDLLRMLGNDHFRKSVLDCWRIYDVKGNDYTRGLGDIDRSDNFKRAAEFNKVSAFQAWGVYFYKHVSAIFRFIGDGKVESEPIEGRIHDVINYSILLLLLAKEQRHDEKQRVNPASLQGQGDRG